MTTRTVEARHITLGLLRNNPGVRFTVTEIRKEIEEKGTLDTSDGVVAGMLYKLTQDSESGVVKVGRGEYVYDANGEFEESLAMQIHRHVASSKKQLKEFASNVDVLDLEDEDFAIIKRLKKSVDELEKFEQDLAKTYNIK